MKKYEYFISFNAILKNKESFDFNTSIIFENNKIDSMEDIESIERNILQRFSDIKELEVGAIKVINYQLLKEIEE